MKQVGKRLLSLLLALCMMMSLCVSALAVNDVTVTATLDTPTLYRKSVAQTVKLRVATSEPITICDYQVKLKLPEGWTVTAMENDDANAQLVPADYNLATGSVVWNGDGEDHSVTNFVIYTVEIPADTKAGRYELSLYEVEANATYGTKPVLTSPDNNTSATLTIKDDDTSNLYKDYCVAFYTGGGSGQSTLQMGTDKNVVSLEVLIQNGIINKGQTYNAYGITLSYDPTILEFVKVGNVDCIYSVENDKVNGTVTVYRSGTQLSCSARDGFFAEFKGIATGSCNVAITRAYVDKGENANVRNAPSANITTTGYIVNVDGPYYNVTASSPQELVYEPYAKANTAYTFTLANGYDWRGMAIRYTIDNGDGISWPVEYDTTKNCYTIPANWVTGDIHIDVSFRNFDVTVEGNAKNDVTLSSTSKPSYRVDYPFTLNKQEGWTYTVAVTVGGKNANYTVSEDGKTYTIAGKDIIGNIVITANKAKGDSQISFSGDTSDLEGEAIRNAPVGEDFTFTIKKDANYDYTVDAKYTESGKTIPVTEDPEGTYTIKGEYITGDAITITITKTAKWKWTVEVSEYVKVGKAQSVFLITAKLNDGVTLDAGSTLAYGDELTLSISWRRQRIEYILKNEKYKGDAILQKSYTTESFPRKRKNNHGERNAYYMEDSHAAIVSDVDFETVQKIRAGHRRSTGITNTVLRGTLYCCCESPLRMRMSGQSVYWVCIRHSHNASACPITQIPEVQIQQAFLQLYYNLKHQGSHILPDLITNLQPIRERKFLWSVDVIELNKQIAELTSQNQLLTTLRESGCVDPDIFISKSNALTEQLRAAKQAKSRILNQDGDDTITGTQELLTILKRGPETLHDFDGELFGQLIDKVIIESNTSLRFRLKNGLELRESIERTVR